MTRARVAVLAVAALAAAALVAALSAGSSASSPAGGPLTWVGKPVVFEQETMPGDWIAAGEVRNRGSEALRLVASKDVKAATADGDELSSSAVFSKTFGHGLFNPTRVPANRLPEGELRRIGNVGVLAPGEALPLTVSWRAGGQGAKLITYPGGALPLPPQSG